MAGKKRTRPTRGGAVQLSSPGVAEAATTAANKAAGDGANTPDGVVWCTPIDPSSSPSRDPSLSAASVSLFAAHSPNGKDSDAVSAVHEQTRTSTKSTVANANSNNNNNRHEHTMKERMNHTSHLTMPQEDDADDAEHMFTATASGADYLRTSKVIAPDVSGIRCLAVSPDSRELVCAREDGSLVRYEVHEFQNIVHFTMLRHSGGRRRRTVTRLHYIPHEDSFAPVCTSVSTHAVMTAAAAAGTNALSQPTIATTVTRPFRLLASYLSGQLVVYDAATLFPLYVHPRSGGAIWDFALASPRVVYTALASNAWHELELMWAPQNRTSHVIDTEDDMSPGGLDRRRRLTATGAEEAVWQSERFRLELRRIVPGVTGAHRALTVTAATEHGFMVGTDDAGHIHAWEHLSTTTMINNNNNNNDKGEEDRKEDKDANRSGAARSLWTTRLPTGIALCCAVVAASPSSLSASSSASAVGAAAFASSSSSSVVDVTVAVGTSTGDVVCVGARDGQLRHVFAQHRGPVTTMLVDRSAATFYASGWHESLRAYRCRWQASSSSAAATLSSIAPAPAGALVWYPAEVKRRTHYHEATQLAALGLPGSFSASSSALQLLLSASRDGTLMYARPADLFARPAMYLPVTTQSFAFARRRNVLLQTRMGRVEAFHPDEAVRHWVPVFAHTLASAFHLRGLWCDAALRYFCVATDERVVLVRVVWEGRGARVRRLEEVLELPAGRGVWDVCFVEAAEEEEERSGGGVDRDAAEADESMRVYLLLDDALVLVHPDMAGGCATHIRTPLHAPTCWAPTSTHKPHSSSSSSLDTAALELQRVVYDADTATVWVFGRQAVWQCAVSRGDGTPQLDTAHWVTVKHGPFARVVTVPQLCESSHGAAHSPAEPRPHAHTTGTNTNTEESTKQERRAASGPCVMGLGQACQGNSEAHTRRYYGDIITETPLALPRTLPQDVQFIAELPAHVSAEYAAVLNPSGSSVGRARGKKRPRLASGVLPASASRVFLGRFSKGLIVTTAYEWRMVSRMVVEAAFVMRGGRHVLVLERNLEKTLESLPLCWKVRRFAN